MGFKNFQKGGYDEYPQAPYQSNYRGRQPKKKSGAKYGVGKNGREYISAWCANKRRGLISFIASPYLDEDGKEFVTENRHGEKAVKWRAKIVFKETGQILWSYALVKPSNPKFFVEELGMIVNPKAPNGGYFGKVGK